MLTTDTLATHQIKMFTQDSPRGTKDTDLKPVLIRWDYLTMGYFLFLSATACVFGGTPTGEYHRGILFIGSFHFATETPFALHMLYPIETAKRLGWLARVCYTLFAVFMLMPDQFVPYLTLHWIFSFTFVFSDGISLGCAIACMMAPDAHPELKRIAFAMCFHWVGVAWEGVNYVIHWYWLPFPTQFGAGWVMIVVVTLPQIYLMRRGIEGRLNHIGPPKMTGRMGLIVPVLTVGGVLVQLSLGYFHTNPDPVRPYWLAPPGPYRDFIAYLFIPYAALGFILATYWFLFAKSLDRAPLTASKDDGVDKYSVQMAASGSVEKL